MSEEDAFRDLIRRVRAGDAQAAEELVRRYEPTIRAMVRPRLTDPRLRRQFDSGDICQSILGHFFVAASAGQFELDTPEQMVKLLATMTRNKVASHVRKQRAARRNPETTPQDLATTQEPVDPGPSPSQAAVIKELRERFRQKLSPVERQLVDLRVAGHSWAEIAAELGGTPDGLRMQYTRAVAQAADELGLEPC